MHKTRYPKHLKQTALCIYFNFSYICIYSMLLRQLMISIEKNTDSIAQMNKRIEEQKQLILEKMTTYVINEFDLFT